MNAPKHGVVGTTEDQGYKIGTIDWKQMATGKRTLVFFVYNSGQVLQLL